MKENSKTPKLPVAKATTAVSTVKPINVHPLSDDQAANAIRQQYQVVIKAEEASFWARARLGAMLLQWEAFLGEARGGAGGGAGGGLKGWLEKNCPELGYDSALSYKNSARMAATMIGGGAVAVAALLGESEVTQPDGEVIDVPCEVVEKRDKLYKDVKSRRKLEQAYFALMAEGEKPKKKAKRKVVPVADPLSMSDSATVMWADAMRVFEENRAAFHSAARDLKPAVARKFLSELKMLVEALEKRVEKD